MRYNKDIYQERSLPMYPLIRRYLRRVDVVYLLLCAACSAISVVVLLSIGQTQLGSNNKASVQLIASLLGLMLAVVFSTADYHALARAWPLHGVVAWGLVLPTLFLHNVNTGLVTIGYDAGGTSNYSWYRVGGMTFQPAELAKNQLYFDAGAAFEPGSRAGEPPQKSAAAFLCTLRCLRRPFMCRVTTARRWCFWASGWSCSTRAGCPTGWWRAA